MPSNDSERRLLSIARSFHNVYEDIAVEEGWMTQEASRGSFDSLPEPNRRTMLRTIEALLVEGVIS